MVVVDVSLVSGGLDKQAGATDLLLAKRSFWLVAALRAGNTVILSLHASLETASALVMQGITLRLVFMASALLAFSFVEANAQIIFRIELRWNTQNVRVALRRLAIALPSVALLTVVTGVAHRVTQLLIPSLTQKILNPRPVLPLPAAVLPALQELVTDV